MCGQWRSLREGPEGPQASSGGLFPCDQLPQHHSVAAADTSDIPCQTVTYICCTKHAALSRRISVTMSGIQMRQHEKALTCDQVPICNPS